MDRATMDAYTRILREELVCAMGCTEPIAIAYAAALARETLGCLPDAVDLSVSPNIIKNVKSVVVPHTGGLKGMRAAASAGIIAGDAAAELEVLAKISPDDLPAIDDDFIGKVRRALDRNELTLANLCVDGPHVWVDDPDGRAEHRKQMIDYIYAADKLGAKTIRSPKTSIVSPWRTAWMSNLSISNGGSRL